MGYTVGVPRSTAPWHQNEVADILAELNSSRLGLSQATVQENIAKYGKNILNEAQPRSRVIVFLGYFWSIPVALLILAAILSIATGSSIDALVIMGVVIINAVLGYVTESKSESIILSLKNLVNPSAWVIRDGKSIEIDSQTIAVGIRWYHTGSTSRRLGSAWRNWPGPSEKKQRHNRWVDQLADYRSSPCAVAAQQSRHS